MEILLYAFLAIVGVGAAGFALVPALAGSNRADKRMKALQGDIRANRQIAETARSRDTRRKQIQDTLKAQNDQLSKTKRRVPLQDQLYQAGMKSRPRTGSATRSSSVSSLRWCVGCCRSSGTLH